jgi:hypothetical protein
MKAISTLMSLVLFCGVAIPCLAIAVPVGSSRVIEKKAQLELTISIVEQYSCAPDSLTLHLRLTYRNTGSKPIILDKRSVAIVDRHLVSRSLKDAVSRKYAQELRPEDFGANYGIDPHSPPDLSQFVIIRPGNAHEVDDTAGLVVDDGTPVTKGALRAGPYFLQAEVGTWPYSSDIQPQLRLKWREQGYLWSQSLTSAPLSFAVEKNRPIRKCT